MTPWGRPAMAAVALLPGALTVYLSFNSGGFFAGPSAAVAVLLALLLAVRAAFAERPFAGLGLAAVLVAAPLALYAIWTLLSQSWSGSPARALLEFDRALLYALALVLFASVPRSHGSVALVVRGVAIAVVVVCVVGLATRVAPDVWAISPNRANERLSYPLTYWNALGLLAALGIIFCLHLSADRREAPVSRVLASAGVPILATTLLLTFSRGAIAAGVVGLIAYGLLGRPRLLPGAVVAIAPPTAVALAVAYGQEELTTSDPTGPGAVAEGHELAAVVALCVLAAGLLRMAMIAVDRRRFGEIRLSAIAPRTVRRTLAVAGVAVGVVFVGSGAPAVLKGEFERFRESEPAVDDGGFRGHLTDPGSSGRIEHWRVALDAFADAPLLGRGAGTYEILWARDRPTAYAVTEGHSLYLEALGELGLVGLLLIGTAVLAMLVGLAVRVRGPDRPLHAAAFAAVLAWASHAAVDWDWEMPAVSLWSFALAGSVLAAAPGRASLSAFRPRAPLRLVVVVAALLLGLAPALTWLSQRQIDRGAEAFRRGDCATAIDAALASTEVLSVRPEPWELIGYCNARLGRPRPAAAAFRQAIRKDPDSWELWYGLAVVRGVGRLGTGTAARQALRLNPLEPRTQEAAEWSRLQSSRAVERQARRAAVPAP